MIRRPNTTPDRALREREEELSRIVRAAGPLAVAFSGGADSALVLAAAARALGPDRVLAVTAVSESLARGELPRAAAFAAGLGVRHLTSRTTELADPRYRANTSDRCYFCKSTVLDAIGALAAAHGFPTVATGTNADDAASPHRPGIRAGQERGVLTPLRDAGLTKEDVRALSRAWQLPTWDKPATPCLASRIRYGLQVSGPRLARVDHAETVARAVLHDAGLRPHDLRVRDLGDTARLELDADLVPAARALDTLTPALAQAGFANAPIEITAFRSGRLNEEPPFTRRAERGPGR